MRGGRHRARSSDSGRVGTGHASSPNRQLWRWGRSAPAARRRRVGCRRHGILPLLGRIHRPHASGVGAMGPRCVANAVRRNTRGGRNGRDGGGGSPNIDLVRRRIGDPPPRLQLCLGDAVDVVPGGAGACGSVLLCGPGGDRGRSRAGGCVVRHSGRSGRVQLCRSALHSCDAVDAVDGGRVRRHPGSDPRYQAHGHYRRSDRGGVAGGVRCHMGGTVGAGRRDAGLAPRLARHRRQDRISDRRQCRSRLERVRCCDTGERSLLVRHGADVTSGPGRDVGGRRRDVDRRPPARGPTPSRLVRCARQPGADRAGVVRGAQQPFRHPRNQGVREHPGRIGRRCRCRHLRGVDRLDAGLRLTPCRRSVTGAAYPSRAARWTRRSFRGSPRFPSSSRAPPER
ncbi:hypothetical protein BH24ACT5_BH24ACT5_19850 [soil metagenome]